MYRRLRTCRCIKALILAIVFVYALPLGTARAERIARKDLADNLAPDEAPNYEVTIPGTDIRVGVYTIENGTTRNLGFKIGRKFMFLGRTDREVISPRPEDEWDQGYYVYGPVGYGIYNGFLIVDWSTGGSGGATDVALFRYSNDTVEFVDYAGGGSRVKVLSEVKQRANDWENPSWTDIRDIDDDGYGEIVFSGPLDYVLEISNQGMRVDLNPDNYKERCANPELPTGPYTGWNYIFCNHIAGSLDLSAVKSKLVNGLDERGYRNAVENLKALDDVSNYGKSAWSRGFTLKQYRYDQ